MSQIRQPARTQGNRRDANASNRGGDRRAGRNDRQHDTASDDRADQRSVRQPGRTVPREKAGKPLVVARNPVHRHQDLRDKQPHEDRETGDDAKETKTPKTYVQTG